MGMDDAEKLYDEILATAMYFLKNCKSFSIEVLAQEDPTYQDVAELMHETARIIWALSDDFDPMLHQKAFDYCDLMTKMGVAIKNHDKVELSKLVDILDKRPFL